MLWYVFSYGRYLPLLFLIPVSCSEREPPAVASPKQQLIQATPARQLDALSAADRSSSRPPSAIASVQGSTSSSNQTAPVPPPASVATLTANAFPAEVQLVDEKGLALPQTEVLPSFDSSSFQQRMRLLFQAIVEDRPEMADAAFFPVVAYEQVKAIAKPARDHKFRLVAAFHRNIHEYHRIFARVTGPIRLVSIEPSNQPARWMVPGSEGNKLGYFRMLRAHVKYTDASGQTYRLEITSMISWRGEWYVVHLNGFK